MSLDNIRMEQLIATKNVMYSMMLIFEMFHSTLAKYLKNMTNLNDKFKILIINSYLLLWHFWATPPPSKGCGPSSWLRCSSYVEVLYCVHGFASKFRCNFLE